MLLVLFQIILTAAACFGLWRLWRSLAGRGTVSLIIGAGFLIRAIAGQILFWISWLHLPMARSLQLGNGFWFFAVDGPGYLSYADELINRGVKAILLATSSYPSHVYLQAFTVATAVFGVVASVAILFNCAAYLMTCAIIARIGSRESSAELPRLVALAAVAFGPGTILWSLQPLKDTFFLLLVTAMIGTCFLWQELWRQGVQKWRRLLACAAFMFILTYAIAGIRWYFAAIVWALCSVFFILVTVPVRPRSAALLSSALLFVLLAQAVRLGGEHDIPRRIRPLLDLRPSVAVPLQPSYATHYIRQTRAGFERMGGATTISAGPALAPVSPPQKLVSPKPQPVSPTPQPVSPQQPVSPLPQAAPQRPVQTLLTGFAAMFVPRFLAQAVGVIRVGGGRGFWFFADTDTLVLDAVVLFAIVYCTRALRSKARITPLFVLLVLVFLMTAAPMMYTVSNFGTLFRLRQMVYLIAAILPLTLAPRIKPYAGSS